MTKTVTPKIINFIEQNKYQTRDLSAVEKSFIEKHKPVPRDMRTDLNPGDLVVILEGKYVSSKVVFIKQLSGFKAVVSGVYDVNGVRPMIIDEKYLFKLNTPGVEIGTFDVNPKELNYSDIDSSKDIEIKQTEASKLIESAVKEGLLKKKFYTSYLKEQFSVDHDVEFYSKIH
ncbi:RL6 [Hepatospora eriocheir]|uniref:RL6 n=1 Tax=Hepatospora eriocheir TaxID=1081669 RepID=A0A1X0QAZ8_9MICR|nr:RL6 [Hepatospora eriocheir]